MRTTVVTVTSRIPDRAREPYYRYGLWIESLKRFGVDPIVLGMSEPFEGLMTKPKRLRDWLKAGGCDTELLIVSDSFDVMFLEHPNVIGNYFNGNWDAEDEILFNAERGLFPRGDLQHNFDNAAIGETSAWKYLNSGFYIGTPAKILQLLDSMMLDEIHGDYQRPDSSWCHPNDQAWFQVAFCCQSVPMMLDYDCEICQTLSACTIDEFDLTGPKIKNKATGSEPMVIHGNGSGKNDVLPFIMTHYGFED